MADSAITAEKLTRRFGEFTAVDAISFEVGRGEVFGFLGANGAGKTTAIKMLTGLLEPTSGSAAVAGFDIAREAESVKRSIGYMSQRFSLYEDLTPMENIRFFGGIYGIAQKEIRERGKELLAGLGLEGVAERKIASLPLGWKQRLAFSVAVFHQPGIVFLDEPTGGVDPVTRRRFWEMLYAAAEKGLTVFVTTHYMDEAEYCDRVSIMVDGRIAALGTPAALKEEADVGSMDELFIQLARPAKEVAP